MVFHKDTNKSGAKANKFTFCRTACFCTVAAFE
nr:MAG TPA: hypothetical protein [Caudoviricetes sp.]